MAWESLKVFRNFEEITGASSGFTKTGYLLAVPEHYRKPMLENLKMQQQLGIDVDEVDFKFVQDLGLNAYPDEGEAYCWEPLSGFADPYSVTVGYANQSRKLGCEIDMGNEVTAIKIDHGRVVGAFGWTLLWVSPMAEIGPLICVREASHGLICGGWVNRGLPPMKLVHISFAWTRGTKPQG